MRRLALLHRRHSVLHDLQAVKGHWRKAVEIGYPVQAGRLLRCFPAPTACCTICKLVQRQSAAQGMWRGLAAGQRYTPAAHHMQPPEHTQQTYTCSAHLLCRQPRLKAVDGQAGGVAAPQLLLRKLLQQFVLGAEAVQQQAVACRQLRPPPPKLRVLPFPQRRLLWRVPLGQAGQQAAHSLLLRSHVYCQVCKRASAAGAHVLPLEVGAGQVSGRLEGAGPAAAAAAPPAALPLGGRGAVGIFALQGQSGCVWLC